MIFNSIAMDIDSADNLAHFPPMTEDAVISMVRADHEDRSMAQLPRQGRQQGLLKRTRALEIYRTHKS